MWAGVILADDEEANTIRASTIFLRVYLGLWSEICASAASK
jgi:hypothetical protein